MDDMATQIIPPWMTQCHLPDYNKERLDGPQPGQRRPAMSVQPGREDRAREWVKREPAADRLSAAAVSVPIPFTLRCPAGQ